MLGRNAPMASVEHWIASPPPLPGYAGFAVGRSIWEEPLRAHLAKQIEADELADQVASTYDGLIHAYVEARRNSPEERDNQ